MRHIVLLLIVALMVGFTLSACQTPAGRSAGSVVDDATISTKIKAMLFDDRRLSGFAIAVETFEGEVTLTGAVNSQEDKESAGRLAASVRGVKAVNNLLKVK